MSSANISPDAGEVPALDLHIVPGCGAVLLLLVAGVAAVKPVRFDYVQSGHRITLNANIKAASRTSPRISPRSRRNSSRPMRNSPRPGECARFCCRKSRDAIDANASISSEVTKITLETGRGQNSRVPIPGKPNRQQCNPRVPHPVMNQRGGALTDEQKKRSRTDEANEQSTDTQSNTTTIQAESDAKARVPGPPSPW